ncbi:MAG: hypothetical protein ACFFD2_15425 [Promethearchaeota archaeon]
MPLNYRDRLSRFGIQIIHEFFSNWTVCLEVMHPTGVESFLLLLDYL